MPIQRHVLHPCCRVREEAFGLLFYDLRGPRLLFAATGGWVDAEVVSQGAALEDAVRAGADAPARERVARMAASLAEKGFLREQPVC